MSLYVYHCDRLTNVININSVCRCTVAFIWIFSISLSAALIRRNYVSNKSWEHMCSPKWEKLPESFIAFILCFSLPFLTLIFCNMSIIFTVKKMNTVQPLRDTETGQKISSSPVKDTIKSRRSLYASVIIYLFFVAPYYVAKFSFMKWKGGLFPTSLFVLYIELMFLSSAFNPLIYAALRKDHRKAMLKTLKLIMQTYRKFKASLEAKYNKIFSCCG